MNEEPVEAWLLLDAAGSVPGSMEDDHPDHCETCRCYGYLEDPKTGGLMVCPTNCVHARALK